MTAVGGLLVTVYLSSWQDKSALMMVAFIKFFLAPAWLFNVIVLLLFRQNLLTVLTVMLFSNVFVGMVLGIVGMMHFEDAVLTVMAPKMGAVSS